MAGEYRQWDHWHPKLLRNAALNRRVGFNIGCGNGQGNRRLSFKVQTTANKDRVAVIDDETWIIVDDVRHSTQAVSINDLDVPDNLIGEQVFCNVIDVTGNASW